MATATRTLTLSIVLLASQTVLAQGLLVNTQSDRRIPLPRPIRPTADESYKIKQLAVRARISDQVAKVQLSQSFVNTGKRPMQVAFVFPLPHDGAIDQLTLLVDGKEFPAKLMPAEEARRIYEDYVRRNQDPALLEWIGPGLLQTRVFPVPAGAERTVTLRYSQLLRKDATLTDFLLPLSTARYTSAPVESVDIEVTINSDMSLTNVYSPTHNVEISRSGPNQAKVSFARKNEIPTSDFRVFYDVAADELGASLISYRPDQSEDGYFLLLASPTADAKVDHLPPKNVVCVFDRSGSMRGDKIKQARDALRFIVGQLEPADHFNIVAYDTSVESFRGQLVPSTEENRKQALGFAESLYAGGGTNIDGAFQSAMAMLDSSRPNYVIFLTDGHPTIGERNEAKIVAAAKKANLVRGRLINIGVGYEVNSRLLDRLAAANHGQSGYVRPNEDIEKHVRRVYSKISAPVMTDIDVDFGFDSLATEEGNPINRRYPGDTIDLFVGDQLVMVGRYRKSGPVDVAIRGTFQDDEYAHEFSASLAAGSSDATYDFIEKLWAIRRIGELIDQIDLHGKNEELVDELVDLSTKHGILTPYTSFLADDQGNLTGFAASRLQTNGRRRSEEALSRLSEVQGRAAFAQRALKSNLRSAINGGEAAVDGYGYGGGALTTAAKFYNNSLAFDIDADHAAASVNVRQVGNTAIYKCGNLWVSSDVSQKKLEEAKEKLRKVARFSPEYFALARTSKINQSLLCQQQPNEELLLEVGGDLVLVQ